MRPLVDVRATPEQLAIISRNAPGVEVIRGAAGSGKTTTALLRLRALTSVFVRRRLRLSLDEPKVLVLTFNRTLRGYIAELAARQANPVPEVSTFASWALRELGMSRAQLVSEPERVAKLAALGAAIPLDPEFLRDEVDYLLGRFTPSALQDYVAARRHGRGATPRVPAALRQRILTEVVGPYCAWKRGIGRIDWSDLPILMLGQGPTQRYDVVVVDETQDLCANQIRAVVGALEETHSVTFVIDTAQRIYANGFTWTEVGLDVRPENCHRLARNYRNTVETARLASALVEGLPPDDDATSPDFAACCRHGPVPQMLRGSYSEQLAHVIERILPAVDLEHESVAFLHPLGGGWFDYTRQRLAAAGYGYVELSRQSEWPATDDNIALCTLSSAKGLEFDHVVILGLGKEMLWSDAEDNDEHDVRARRLLAMGIGRARHSVILGHKPGEGARILGHLDPDSYELVDL